MAKEVFILGAGGFARETLDIYVDLGREKEVLGFLEEKCQNDGSILNGKPIHDVLILKKLSRQDKPLLIGAIGSTKRMNLILRLKKEGYEFDAIIHPSAIHSRWVKFGEGSIITPGVILTCQINIGNHVILNIGSKIGHDVKIGDYSTVSPGAEIMGCSSLGSQVYVGTNATIIEKISVGNGAVIAAGAVVTKDVPEMALVAGVPAVVKKIYRSQDEKPW